MRCEFILIIITQTILVKAFERIFLKAFTDPTNMQTKDFWLAALQEDQIQFKEYLNCNGDNYFGPLPNQAMIVYESDNILNPHKSIKGQFNLLLINHQSQFQIYSDQINIQLNDERVEYFQEITKLNLNVQCNSQLGKHSVYRVKFAFLKGLSKTVSDQILDFDISINLDGIAEKWAVKQIILAGNFCQWDCMECAVNENICTDCNHIGGMFNYVKKSGDSCVCVENAQPISIAPLACSKANSNTKIQDRCELEYVRYVKDAYYSPQCVIEKDENSEKEYFKCEIQNTEGFPISDTCFDDRIVYVCNRIIQNQELVSVCFYTDKNKNGLQYEFSNDFKFSKLSFPVENLNFLSLTFKIYSPASDVWNLNFTIHFEHLQNIIIDQKNKKSLYTITWKSVVMRDSIQYSIFDIFNQYNPQKPQLYFCSDETCATTLTSKKQKQIMYFRVYSDQLVQGFSIEIIDIKQINDKFQLIYDLMNTLTLVQQIDNNDQIFQIKLKASSQLRILQGSDFQKEIADDQIYIQTDWIESTDTNRKTRTLQFFDDHTLEVSYDF